MTFRKKKKQMLMGEPELGMKFTDIYWKKYKRNYQRQIDKYNAKKGKEGE